MPKLTNDENAMSDELDALILSWREKGADRDEVVSVLELALYAARDIAEEWRA